MSSRDNNFHTDIMSKFLEVFVIVTDKWKNQVWESYYSEISFTYFLNTDRVFRIKGDFFVLGYMFFQNLDPNNELDVNSSWHLLKIKRKNKSHLFNVNIIF